jgi:biotin transport system ATP-binding protein/energy-coupling factor transport system ATP-binding protein
MISVENITYRYDQNDPVLRSLNMSIGDGEYVALIGPNGCGKTTLIKHLNALLFPSDGVVLVDGINTKDSSAVREIRRRVGMVFQNPDNQIIGMSVEEDVAFGPGNLGLPSSEIRERVDASLAMVGMADYAKRAPHTLSGGEKRLISIAGVLAMKPRYIAFDEPTASLDPSSRQRVIDIIRKLNKEGIAIIHIAHDMDEIIHADRVMVMDRGGISVSGTPREVFARTDYLKTLGLHIPQVVELLWKLRQMGWDVSTDVLTIEEACLEIAASAGDHSDTGDSGRVRKRMGEYV